MLNMLKKMLSMIDRSEKKEFRIYLLLSAIAPVIDLVGVSAILPILQRMSTGQVSKKVLAAIIGLGCLILVKGVLDLVKSRVATGFIYKTSQKLSAKVFDEHMKEELLEHNDRSSAGMLTAVRSDTIESVRLISGFVSLAVSAFTWVGLGAVLIWVAGWFGLICMVAMLLFMLLMYLINRKRIRKFGEKRRNLDIRINAIVTSAYGAYKELKINTKSGNMLTRYENTCDEYTEMQRDYNFLSRMVSVIMQNTLQASIYFVLAVFVCLDVNITEKIAQIIAFLTVFIKFVPQTSIIVGNMNTIKFGEKSYREFMKNIAQYDRIVENEKKRSTMRRHKMTIRRSLRVENLTFAYPGGRKIFDNASVDLPAGHTIAIVGNSGIGKTSFLDLILGLLKPESGHIWFDDYDIVDGADGEGACYGNLGEIVSYIPQVVYMNGDTVRNNVLFMTDPQDADEARVRECLECAHIWEDVSAMPQGMDTVIGANGVGISGGQRQRIALARALYRDFDMLVMDEATAALNTETEAAVIDSIEQFSRDKTLLMVTHHMSLAERCEYIYKIEDCKIVKVR